MDPEFAAYLERVRAHRAELGESMAALDAALALPIGLGPLWRRRVRAALTELEHDLRDHRAITEQPGGLYADAVARAPRLASVSKLQMEEHLDFVEVVQRLLGEREAGLAEPRKPLRHTGKRPQSSSAGSCVTGSAAPTSSTRPTRSTSAAAAERSSRGGACLASLGWSGPGRRTREFVVDMLHAAIAIALAILLIIRFKVDPVISLVLSALYLGLAAGVGLAGTLKEITGGFGEIMAEVGLLIGFGVLIGSLLQATGTFASLVEIIARRVGGPTALRHLGGPRDDLPVDLRRRAGRPRRTMARESAPIIDRKVGCRGSPARSGWASSRATCSSCRGWPRSRSPDSSTCRSAPTSSSACPSACSRRSSSRGSSASCCDPHVGPRHGHRRGRGRAPEPPRVRAAHRPHGGDGALGRRRPSRRRRDGADAAGRVGPRARAAASGPAAAARAAAADPRPARAHRLRGVRRPAGLLERRHRLRRRRQPRPLRRAAHRLRHRPRHPRDRAHRRRPSAAASGPPARSCSSPASVARSAP